MPDSSNQETSVNSNHAETLKFLTEIAKDRTSGYLWISTLLDDKDAPNRGVEWLSLLVAIDTPIKSVDLKYKMDEAHKLGRGFFINTVTTDASRKRNEKPKGEIGDDNYDPGNHCLDPLAIVADYDKGVIPPTDEQLIELRSPLPTVRVKSGGGWHLWWFLKENSCTKELRNKIVERIAIVTHADQSMKSDTRILRLPGSVHLKNPAEPKLVKIIEANYDRRYTPTDFEQFLATTEPEPELKQTKTKSKSKIKESDPSNSDIRSFAPYLVGFNDGGGDWIKAKCPAHDGGSSDSLHINSKTGGFKCHAECSSHSVYAAAKAVAVAGGHQVDNTEDRKCGFYSSIEEGLVLVYDKSSDEGTVRKTTRIGNHIQAIARVDNPHNNQAALLLELQTANFDTRQVTILRADLAGDGTAIVAKLMSLSYSFKRKQRANLLDYLHGLGGGIDRKYTVTSATGWHGESFVLPHKTIGDVDLRYRDIEPAHDVITELKGSLDDWKDNIGKYCNANSRLTFCLGLAFVAPILKIVGMQGFGFHLVGDSSAGKSIALSVAASVIGEKMLTTWSTTANGLEAIAAAHNELLLTLDEVGESEPRELSKVAYMLGNGQGKTRMTKELVNRETKTWLLATLSSGEKGMAEYMAEAGKVQKSGQEVRIADLPAVPFNSLFGLFETIHGLESSEVLALLIEAACKEYRGSAIDVFLNRLVIDRADDSFPAKLKLRVKEISKSLEANTADRAVGRVIKHFALVQVALELAHSYGILPFGIVNIEWSVKKMSDDWLFNRGGDGSIEIKQACKKIQHLLVTNQHSDRVYKMWESTKQTVRNLLAYESRASIPGPHNPVFAYELLVPPSVFDEEFAKGVNKDQLIAELQQRGWLTPPSSNEKRATLQRRVEGKPLRLYVFTSKVLGHLEESKDELLPSTLVVEPTLGDDYEPF